MKVITVTRSTGVARLAADHALCAVRDALYPGMVIIVAKGDKSYRIVLSPEEIARLHEFATAHKSFKEICPF